MFRWLRRVYSAAMGLVRTNRRPASLKVRDGAERRAVRIVGFRGVHLVVQDRDGVRLVNERQACDPAAFRRAWRAWTKGSTVAWEESRQG